MGKQRSPNYPAISLREAVEAIRAIYDKERKTAVSAEVMVQPLGYTSLSGNARTKLAALKKYGLVEGNDKGLRVSDLAVHVLYPKDDIDRLDSLREAALRPELFKAMFSEFRDGSDEAIRHYLINRLDFAPLGAKQVIAAFRDTLSYAGLGKSGYNDSNALDKPEAGDSMEPVGTPYRQDATVPITGVGMQGSVGKVHVNNWTWTLSVPRSVNAELRIAGTPTKADIGRLKKQIEFLEGAFEDEAAE